MAGKAADFNYKVALASGLKSLQSGRLKQAEEQFHYLCAHFPTAEGGYRGLAKVFLQQDDRRGALKVLLDGGAALAKGGQREGAISVYKEAVQLDPHDRTAHRRLASSLALAGEEEAAAHEYVRFIREATDPAVAQREAEYALERMPHNEQIAEVARGVGAAPITPASTTQVASHTPVDDREELIRSAFAAAPTPPTPTPPTPTEPPAAPVWASEPTAPAPAEANGESVGADVDDTTVEATAARYLAKGDPRGGTAALEAARRYIAGGHIDAASDLLLQLIAAGISVHDAQRLLFDVTKNLGKKDVAKAKLHLLVQALKLAGHTDQAAEVEQLAEQG